jgi:hypothetical protein
MPSPADYSQAERDHDQAVLEAARLAFVVHEYDRAAVAALVEHLRHSRRLEKVLVALAVMVDIDKPLHELVGWMHAHHDRAVAAAERKPWERESYPLCLPELDGSPEGCQSKHGTPARHTAGCRGEGCVQARKDYDAWRWRERRDAAHTPEPVHSVSDAAEVC